MRKIYLLFLLSISTTYIYAQSGQKWAVGGNGISNGDFLGTTNNQELSLRTNNIERFRISASGNYFFNGLTGNSIALMSLNANGKASRIDFTGNATDVLLGNGTFGSYSAISGWSLTSNTLFTPHNIAIDAPHVPGYKMTINGNVLVGGKISATELEVVELIFADTIKGGQSLKIRESLCFHGYNANDPNSRNEICGKGNDLYIMSENNGYHTIFNYGNTGNVGIGTNSPQAKLDINGDLKVSGVFKTNYISTSQISGIDSVLAFGDSTVYLNTFYNNFYPGLVGTIKGLGFGRITVARGLNSTAIGNRAETSVLAEGAIIIGKGAGTTSIINDIPNSLMIGFNSNRPTIYVSPSNGLFTVGSVGIGTTSPEDRFQIGEGIEKVSFGSANYGDLGFGTSYIGFNASRTSSGWKTSGAIDHNGGSVIYGTTLGNIHFVSIPTTQSSNDQTGITDQQILDNTKMMIWDDGRVGIGTTCVPLNQKLAVAGGIICEEFTVDIRDQAGCWPDYVFEDTYELMTLKEVEEYIERHKRLPGIPSAESIEENGIVVSEILIKHTEKIEELTLYLIELNKKIELLEMENKKLKLKLELK